MKTKTIFLILLLVTLTRITLLALAMPIPNFSPINAMMLLSGAYFINRISACSIALFTMWFSDLFINYLFFGSLVLFYPGCFWPYAAYAFIVLLGRMLKTRMKSSYLLFTSLSASTLFFVMSNFGVWLSGLLYPQTLDGLVACYIAALPFFKNAMLSDLFFVAIIFGGWAVMNKIKTQSLQSEYRSS